MTDERDTRLGPLDRRSDPDDEIAAAVAVAVATVEAAGGTVDEVGIGWLAAGLTATAAPGEFAIGGGFGGHELALLDFDPSGADELRRLGEAVATPPAPDRVVALALTGSAAQGWVQPFPADTDFFERVHLLTPTRAEALARLAAIVRETVDRVEARPGFALEEVWFGSLPPSTAAAQPHRFGSALAWGRAEVAAGVVELAEPRGGAVRAVTWAEAAVDPGFVKFDWFVTDRADGGPTRVSKVIDPTWAGPDGRVESLDGAIDADFQQIYLAATAADLARSLIAEGHATGVEDRLAYALAMERDVVAYACRALPDFAKVAKRLYNLCRTTARYPEALMLRDLLATEPARLARLRAALDVATLVLDDPAQAEAEPPLAAWFDDLCEVLGEDAGCAPALAACRRALAEQRRERLRTAIQELDDLLGERINAGFRERLLAYGLTAALLAELHERHR